MKTRHQEAEDASSPGSIRCASLVELPIDDARCREIYDILDEDTLTAKQFRCRICYKTFKSPYYIKRHVEGHLNRSPTFCPLCGPTFRGVQGLRCHLRTLHATERIWQCAHCTQFFGSDADLDVHVIDEIHAIQSPPLFPAPSPKRAAPAVSSHSLFCSPMKTRNQRTTEDAAMPYTSASFPPTQTTRVMMSQRANSMAPLRPPTRAHPRRDEDDVLLEFLQPSRQMMEGSSEYMEQPSTASVDYGGARSLRSRTVKTAQGEGMGSKRKGRKIPDDSARPDEWHRPLKKRVKCEPPDEIEEPMVDGDVQGRVADIEQHGVEGDEGMGQGRAGNRMHHRHSEDDMALLDALIKANGDATPTGSCVQRERREVRKRETMDEEWRPPDRCPDLQHIPLFPEHRRSSRLQLRQAMAASALEHHQAADLNHNLRVPTVVTMSRTRRTVERREERVTRYEEGMREREEEEEGEGRQGSGKNPRPAPTAPLTVDKDEEEEVERVESGGGTREAETAAPTSPYVQHSVSHTSTAIEHLYREVETAAPTSPYVQHSMSHTSTAIEDLSHPCSIPPSPLAAIGASLSEQSLFHAPLAMTPLGSPPPEQPEEIAASFIVACAAQEEQQQLVKRATSVAAAVHHRQTPSPSGMIRSPRMFICVPSPSAASSMPGSPLMSMASTCATATTLSASSSRSSPAICAPSSQSYSIPEHQQTPELVKHQNVRKSMWVQLQRKKMQEIVTPAPQPIDSPNSSSEDCVVLAESPAVAMSRTASVRPPARAREKQIPYPTPPPSRSSNISACSLATVPVSSALYSSAPICTLRRPQQAPATKNLRALQQPQQCRAVSVAAPPIVIRKTQLPAPPTTATPPAQRHQQQQPVSLMMRLVRVMWRIEQCSMPLPPLRPLLPAVAALRNVDMDVLDDRQIRPPVTESLLEWQSSVEAVVKQPGEPIYSSAHTNHTASKKGADVVELRGKVLKEEKKWWQVRTWPSFAACRLPRSTLSMPACGPKQRAEKIRGIFGFRPLPVQTSRASALRLKSTYTASKRVFMTPKVRPTLAVPVRQLNVQQATPIAASPAPPEGFEPSRFVSSNPLTAAQHVQQYQHTTSQRHWHRKPDLKAMSLLGVKRSVDGQCAQSSGQREEDGDRAGTSGTQTRPRKQGGGGRGRQFMAHNTTDAVEEVVVNEMVKRIRTSFAESYPEAAAKEDRRGKLIGVQLPALTLPPPSKDKYTVTDDGATLTVL